MNGFKQFSLSFGKYFQAIGFINRNGMAWFYIFPVLFSVLLFFLGITATSELADQVKVWIGLDTMDLPSWVMWSINVIFWIMFLIFFAFFSGFIILILMSPVIAYVAEKTADILEGQGSGQGGFADFFKNLWRGISLSLINMAYEIFFSILFFFIGLVPVIGWFVAPVGMFFVSSYFFGFAFIDYMNERARRNVKESRAWVYKHKGLALGSGMPYGLVMMIPFFGTIIGCFLCIVGAVAGSMSMHEYRVAVEEKY